MSSWIPDSVTELGGRADMVQLWLIILMVFWFVACNGAMIYFLMKYKRKGPDDKVLAVRGNHLLEIVWTVVPSIIVIIIFVAGIGVWTDLRTPPDDSFEIRVRGQKWSWSFEYIDPDHEYGENLDGRIVPADLYVPVGRNIRFNMKSNDVLHSMFIPEFRVKEDVVPSMFTHLWFRAEVPGSYNIFCTEYCGDKHSGMLGKVHVLDEATWERFINNEPLDPRDRPLTPVESGENLYVKHNCKGCHSVDGTTTIGPTFKGLMAMQSRDFSNVKAVDFTADGNREAAVENYIMQSIKQPESQLVKGFPAGQMPAFEGIITDNEIADIITYIKSLNKSEE